MPSGYGSYWGRLSRTQKAFLAFVALYLVLYFSRVAPTLQMFVGICTVLVGLAAAFQLARQGLRKAIWRLRNRLMVAYLFIAVVPLFLVVALVALAGYVVIGQMAVYLVNKELDSRENQLQRAAMAMARFPASNPDVATSRTADIIRHSFPEFDLLVSGEHAIRFPADTTLTHPPRTWEERAQGGLIVRKSADGERLYAWAHAIERGNDITIVAPITHELLSSLVPGLGDVTFTRVMGRSHRSHVPAPLNYFDFRVTFADPVIIPSWESPKIIVPQTYLFVDTRLFAVLSQVFGQKVDWGEQILSVLIGVSLLFVLVEMASLVAGVSLSRSITGAVHELYQGTQRIKEGDFSYRIPVKGNDQLAELGTSFNTMTEYLGRLIVVAKEKERLESELEIAREVQNQLFPKDVPFTRTLELKGVCNPARMVSGDYYDFMALADNKLAFAIGDVAGKGISAALLMAAIQSTMRTQLNVSPNGAPHIFSTAKLVANLNRQLYATTSPEKYATFYFAIYDDATHSLTYTNAGHLSPILLRGGDFHMMDSTGTVVGAFPIAKYAEKTIPLEHGDILVAYTDGIVEPENAYGEMYGEERLKDLLVKYANTDSSEVIARAMEAVVEWTGAGELQDDMTMVVARRL
jgi:sigma-B regulation protein RsbU (phosphoserine phosphatase)